ncbi:hypothetical protein BX666DRAFT_1878297 [Dichotomocladium elegans]|nr:hypothetical protein BX666DRAFT_1878297 [Dichotomocladium elegans]
MSRWRGSLSNTTLAFCLSRLPFLAAPLPPLYSPDMLCCVEQVELQEDLRARLTDSLHDCCEAAFAHSQLGAAATTTTPSALRFASLFATPPRKILTLSPLKQQHSLHDIQQGPQIWSDAFIFARDKLVVRCSRVDDDLPRDDIPSEALYFLKSMASEYADQAAAREGSIHILEQKRNRPIEPKDLAEQRNRPSASSSRSHRSETNSTLIDKKKAYKSPSDCPPTPQPSSSEATSQKSSISFVYDSSSLSAPFKSAPTSPGPRSRWDGGRGTDRLSARTSLRNMFSTFLQAEQVDDDVAPNEGKIMSRWVRFNHDSLVLCMILLVHLGDGLCATVVFRDDQQERDDDTPDVIPDRMTNHESVRSLRTRLQEHLKDYISFLMTKAITHFSISSFITLYPGVLHFIHTHDGVMLAPRIIDLTHLNQDHELLLEIGQKYQEWNTCTSCEPTTKWGWPSIGKLRMLVSTWCGHRPPLPIAANNCASLRRYNGEYLQAMYFSFIPHHVVQEMHERLFQDISQRSLLAT